MATTACTQKNTLTDCPSSRTAGVLLRTKDAPHENCAQVNDLPDEHIDHVAPRIKELKALERQLKTLRESCRESQQARQCGILTELSSASRQVHEPATRRGHVHGAHSLK